MDTSRLPQAKRIALARLQGAAPRLARGRRDRGEPADPIAALHAISTDPELLGLAAGVLLLDAWRAAAVELLRATGADMQVAADHVAWLRERRAGRGGGPVL